MEVWLKRSNLRDFEKNLSTGTFLNIGRKKGPILDFLGSREPKKGPNWNFIILGGRPLGAL